MSSLETYQSIGEKGEHFFSHTVIDNRRELQASIFSTEAIYEDQLIFRGVNEAKFKLYNSLQRFWILKDLNKSDFDYNQFIEMLIEEVKGWNNKTVQSWFKTIDINNNNSLAYLSFMQHIGLPTPMLDFTKNIYKGLYFAANEVQDRYTENELDNYISLYAISKDSVVFQMLEILVETYQEVTDENIHLNSSLPYNTFKELEVAIAVDEDILTEMSNINNSINIVNQEGLFVFSNFKSLPLEDQVVELKDENYQLANDIHCYDIHKSLQDVILDLLYSKKIHEKFMFPSYQNLRAEALSEVLSNMPLR